LLSRAAFQKEERKKGKRSIKVFTLKASIDTLVNPTKMSTDAPAAVPSSSSSSSSGGRSAPAHVLFASLHALSAWLSVKSLALAHHDDGDDIIVTANTSGPRSALALLHRSACAINLLRSAMRTYQELRNEKWRRQKQQRRRRISKKRKSVVLDWVFLRNTQTNAHDAKSTLERGERNCIA